MREVRPRPGLARASSRRPARGSPPQAGTSCPHGLQPPAHAAGSDPLNQPGPGTPGRAAVLGCGAGREAACCRCDSCPPGGACALTEGFLTGGPSQKALDCWRQGAPRCKRHHSCQSPSLGLVTPRLWVTDRKPRAPGQGLGAALCYPASGGCAGLGCGARPEGGSENSSGLREGDPGSPSGRGQQEPPAGQSRLLRASCCAQNRRRHRAVQKSC